MISARLIAQISQRLKFVRYQVHPEIRKVSPRASALEWSRYELIVDFRHLSRCISETVQDMTRVAIEH